MNREEPKHTPTIGNISVVPWLADYTPESRSPTPPVPAVFTYVKHNPDRVDPLLIVAAPPAPIDMGPEPTDDLDDIMGLFEMPINIETCSKAVNTERPQHPSLIANLLAMNENEVKVSIETVERSCFDFKLSEFLTYTSQPAGRVVSRVQTAFKENLSTPILVHYVTNDPKFTASRVYDYITMHR